MLLKLNALRKAGAETWKRSEGGPIWSLDADLWRQGWSSVQGARRAGGVRGAGTGRAGRAVAHVHVEPKLPGRPLPLLRLLMAHVRELAIFSIF